MRTLVDLPETDVRALDDIGHRHGASRAKIIRQAISEYLARTGGGDMEAAFGLWRDRAVDGLAYQAKARAEW